MQAREWTRRADPCSASCSSASPACGAAGWAAWPRAATSTGAQPLAARVLRHRRVRDSGPHPAMVRRGARERLPGRRPLRLCRHGEIAVSALAGLANITALNLANNLLSGQLTAAALARLTRLRILNLPSRVFLALRSFSSAAAAEFRRPTNLRRASPDLVVRSFCSVFFKRAAFSMLLTFTASPSAELVAAAVRSFAGESLPQLLRRSSQGPLPSSPSGEEFAKRALDSFDPDPYIFWKDQDGQDPASRLGLQSQPGPLMTWLCLRSMSTCCPCAEAGTSLWTSSWPRARRTRPPSDDGSSPSLQALPDRALGEKKVGVRRYAQMPTASALRSSLAQGRRIRGFRKDLDSLLTQARHHPADTGTSNIGARRKCCGASLQLLLSLRKDNFRAESSAPKVPTRVVRLPLPSPRTILAKRSSARAASAAPPPKTSRLTKGKAMAPGTSSAGQQPLVLHVSKAAQNTVTKATGLLGRITDFKRRGQDLGHLLPYAQKWNAADITPATRGLGKDRLPAPDPVGNRSSEEHFTRLRYAVKELDSAWYDATNNLMLTADARKTLFEELLWEHRELVEAHDNAQASIDALKEQLANAQRQDERGSENASNATVVLQAELEELAKARKSAEEKAARLEEEHKECNQLILQTDALAHRDPFSSLHGLFPDSRLVKKVNARRPSQSQANLAVPWTPNDHLVALNARVSHMRAIDRSLSDIPDRIREWRLAAPERLVLRVARSRYPSSTRMPSPECAARNRSDPILTAKRQDRAYRIAEYAEMRTFIPPPHGVQDYLDEEEDEAEEEPLDDAGRRRSSEAPCLILYLKIYLPLGPVWLKTMFC
ncbi:hypothetical protein QYE76_004766 [Lolium multiflorum]|uniref:Uncharacterized protein n=1 Tax=Lolium multiflorum TaxID=4521 RepID=A0AAD8W2S1_LOLMU|nr:hypothetical protein QYE76_004766 [Lolium multiflorum]